MSFVDMAAIGRCTLCTWTRICIWSWSFHFRTFVNYYHWSTIVCIPSLLLTIRTWSNDNPYVDVVGLIYNKFYSIYHIKFHISNFHMLSALLSLNPNVWVIYQMSQVLDNMDYRPIPAHIYHSYIEYLRREYPKSNVYVMCRENCDFK